MAASERILNSLVFSFRTTVRAIRDSLRDAAQTFSARRRITGSVSPSGAHAQTCLRRIWIWWADWDHLAIDRCRGEFVETHAISTEVLFECR